MFCPGGGTAYSERNLVAARAYSAFVGRVMMLAFYEESMADRVLKAFKHAAELRRDQEPF